MRPVTFISVPLGALRVEHLRAISKTPSCQRRVNPVLKTEQLPTRIFNVRSNQRSTRDRGLFMFDFGLVHDIHRGLVTCKFANRDCSRTESQRVSITCLRFASRDRSRTESQRVSISCFMFKNLDHGRTESQRVGFLDKQ